MSSGLTSSATSGWPSWASRSAVVDLPARGSRDGDALSVYLHDARVKGESASLSEQQRRDGAVQPHRDSPGRNVRVRLEADPATAFDGERPDSGDRQDRPLTLGDEVSQARGEWPVHHRLLHLEARRRQLDPHAEELVRHRLTVDRAAASRRSNQRR